MSGAINEEIPSTSTLSYFDGTERLQPKHDAFIASFTYFFTQVLQHKNFKKLGQLRTDEAILRRFDLIFGEQSVDPNLEPLAQYTSLSEANLELAYRIGKHAAEFAVKNFLLLEHEEKPSTSREQEDSKECNSKHQSTIIQENMEIDFPDKGKSTSADTENGGSTHKSIPKSDDQHNKEPASSTTKNTNKKKSHKKKKAAPVSPEKVVIPAPTPEINENHVRDVMVYDIPARYSQEQIANALTSWGRPVSFTTKTQRKYQSVRVKIEMNAPTLTSFDKGTWMHELDNLPIRWFPGTWTLKQRKNREKFKLVINSLPETIAATESRTDTRYGLLHRFEVRSHKIIKTTKGDLQLIGYFEKYEDVQRALNAKFQLEDKDYRWSKFLPPPRRKSTKQSSPQHKTPRPNTKPNNDTTSRNHKNKKRPSVPTDKKAELLAMLLELLA